MSQFLTVDSALEGTRGFLPSQFRVRMVGWGTYDQGRGIVMSLESLIESEVNRFQRKDLEAAGWITVDVDLNSRKLVNRPSFLGQIFSTVTYALNPRGLARHVVRGCLFSEPLGRNKVACDVELTLSFPDQSEYAPARARATVSDLARLSLNPALAIEMLVQASAAKIQGELKKETIYDFDAVVLPRFNGDLVQTLWRAGLKADVSIEWEGYVESEPYNMDDIVVPFRIPGVARRLETKLSCEIVPEPGLKAVIASLKPDKARLARAAREAVAAYFDDAGLFDKLLRNHGAVEAGCGRLIDERLKPIAHRLRGFALSKPQGLPVAPPEQIQVEVETPIQLSDSEQPVPLKHTAQLVLKDHGKFIVKSLDQAIDPKEYAVMVIRGAAAKLLQGKTFVDLVQAFVLDPLNHQRTQQPPKLTLGNDFGSEIKNGLREIGYDIHHIATAPKAKLVELLIQSPNIALAQKEFQLKGGAVVTLAVGFSGNLTSLDEIRGRMTLETDPVADMQTDLPGIVQAVLGDVSPFEYDTGTPLGESGESWHARLDRKLRERLKSTYGFTAHNLQINAQESVPRSYLRHLQAGGGHSFEIDNYSPGEDGRSGGLTLRITYSVKEPRPGDTSAGGYEPYRTYERYIEASLYAFEVGEVHSRIQSAVKGQLNPILSRLTRDQILAMLANARDGHDATLRGYYRSLVQRAKSFVAETFGLIIDLSIVVESDDPRGFATIVAESDIQEFKDRKNIERAVRTSKAETARLAWDKYHTALLKYEPETADASEKQALEELKRTAKEIEAESEMGKGTHIGSALQGLGGSRASADLSLIFGPQAEAPPHIPDSKHRPDRDNIIDIEGQ
jgi:hypothetical protein